MNKVHAVDAQHDRRSLCHTYVTSKRQVIMTTKTEDVTCTKCLAKQAKEAA